MNNPLICKIEIGAELISESSGHVKRVNLAYHSTNLMSGQLNLMPNKYTCSKPHELVVDEHVLKALNEYGTQFTLNTQMTQIDSKKDAKNKATLGTKNLNQTFLSFHQADIHIPSVYDEQELIVNQLNELELAKPPQQHNKKKKEKKKISSQSQLGSSLLKNGTDVSHLDKISNSHGVQKVNHSSNTPKNNISQVVDGYVRGNDDDGEEADGDDSDAEEEEDDDEILMPHLSVKKDPVRVHQGFQFSLDLNKLKLVHSDTYKLFKQQLSAEEKLKIGMKSGIVIRKPAVHFRQNSSSTASHFGHTKTRSESEKKMLRRQERKRRSTHDGTLIRNAGAAFENGKAGGIADGATSSANSSRPSSVEPAPHHYNHPDWHLEHDYEDSTKETKAQLLETLHKKLMLETKAHAHSVKLDIQKLKDPTSAPIFVGENVYKRIHIPSLYHHKLSTASKEKERTERATEIQKKKKTLDYGYAAYIEQTKKYTKSKLSIGLDNQAFSSSFSSRNSISRKQSRVPVMSGGRKSLFFQENQGGDLDHSPRKAMTSKKVKFTDGSADQEEINETEDNEKIKSETMKRSRHHRNSSSKKIVKTDVPELDTDFLYKRERSTYRKHATDAETIDDNADARNNILTTDKITLSWSPLLLGQSEITRVFPLRNFVHGRLKLTVKITGQWINPSLIQKLKPAYFQIKTIENLPETPIRQQELSRICRPIHVVFNIFGLRLTCYGQQKPDRTRIVSFETGKIVFLGLIKESLLHAQNSNNSNNNNNNQKDVNLHATNHLRDFISTARLIVEVHDRDPRRNIDDSNERLTDDVMDYPHGIASFGTLHKLRSQIVPSRTTVTSKVPQGHYIEQGSCLTLEISTPYPYFQNFKMRNLSLKDRAGKYQKAVIYGKTLDFELFWSHFEDPQLMGICGCLVNDTELCYLMVESTSDVIDMLLIHATKYHLDCLFDNKYITEYRDWREPLITIKLGIPVDQFITNVQIHIKNKASFEILQFLSHLQMIKEFTFMAAAEQITIKKSKQIIEYYQQVKHVRFLELMDLALLVPSLKSSNLYRSQIFGSVFLSSPSVTNIHHQQTKNSNHQRLRPSSASGSRSQVLTHTHHGTSISNLNTSKHTLSKSLFIP